MGNLYFTEIDENGNAKDEQFLGKSGPLKVELDTGEVIAFKDRELTEQDSIEADLLAAIHRLIESAEKAGVRSEKWMSAKKAAKRAVQRAEARE